MHRIQLFLFLLLIHSFLAQHSGAGESITVELDFTTQLPRVVARTGYAGDFHAVAQWYPKIGVLDEGGWEAHSFTVHDEFFANFGNYTVVLDVPEATIVGATGVRTAEEVADDRKRLTYEAEMVHDFVWMSDPDFVEHYGEYDGIRVRQLIHPERVGDADAHMEAQLAAFASYEKRYGPYPWSTLTIVHPPKGGAGAGGMEYPTLYTTSDLAPLPGWVRKHILDEQFSGIFTTIHEYGHQYFQGMFATREHLEPWLDEGMNTFSNVLAYIDWQGANPWLVDLLSQKLYMRDMVRLRMRARTGVEPVAQRAKDFENVLFHYGGTVYGKPAALMQTLRNLAGPDDFDRALRIWCDRVRFRHPTGEDLVATLIEELGGRVRLGETDGRPVELDVAEFLEQALHTTREVDFTLLTVRNRRLLGSAGWQRDADGNLTGGDPPENLDTPIEELGDDEVQGVVSVHRVGSFEVPVELLVEFTDGTSERRWWNGPGTSETFEWPGRRVKVAVLDPDHKLNLEYRRLDNIAFAPDVEESDGLTEPLGDLTEAFQLAVLGALGP